MMEVPKPAEPAQRGGCWLASGSVQLHRGVENDFRPAKQAHPALGCGDYAALVKRLRHAGIEVNEPDDIPGVKRCRLHAPLGNRLELIGG
jgi:hypothetical protein